jgi:hypothetical protein
MHVLRAWPSSSLGSVCIHAYSFAFISAFVTAYFVLAWTLATIFKIFVNPESIKGKYESNLSSAEHDHVLVQYTACIFIICSFVTYLPPALLLLATYRLDTGARKMSSNIDISQGPYAEGCCRSAPAQVVQQSTFNDTEHQDVPAVLSEDRAKPRRVECEQSSFDLLIMVFYFVHAACALFFLCSRKNLAFVAFPLTAKDLNSELNLLPFNLPALSSWFAMVVVLLFRAGWLSVKSGHSFVSGVYRVLSQEESEG